MVFTEKSVTGLVLALALATNLSSGFVVPNHASKAKSGTNLGSFAEEEWFYEEKKTLYSEEETERGKRKYTKRPGGKTQVFHNNYPLSPNRPAAKPSPYIPVAISTDQQWYLQETTLSYDATLRQRIAPPTPKTRAARTGNAGSDDQGMRAPMPAVEPTDDDTAESPYQPAAHSEKNYKDRRFDYSSSQHG
mmetsp:Transcript_34459/g.83616  ORF Transcript_34459/g.83616 Transcript_34459/m.83616 type:complete len:191 (-) Transcript_34459:50-622(-)